MQDEFRERAIEEGARVLAEVLNESDSEDEEDDVDDGVSSFFIKFFCFLTHLTSLCLRLFFLIFAFVGKLFFCYRLCGWKSRICTFVIHSYLCW